MFVCWFVSVQLRFLWACCSSLFDHFYIALFFNVVDLGVILFLLLFLLHFSFYAVFIVLNRLLFATPQRSTDLQSQPFCDILYIMSACDLTRLASAAATTTAGGGGAGAAAALTETTDSPLARTLIVLQHTFAASVKVLEHFNQLGLHAESSSERPHPVNIFSRWLLDLCVNKEYAPAEDIVALALGTLRILCVAEESPATVGCPL